MNKKKPANLFIMVKPNILMSVGFAFIVGTGFLGEYLSWGRIPYKPFTNALGYIVFVAGWILHIYCHRFHKQAHNKLEQIQKVINSGPFSIIRHPMYLSLILMFLGLGFAWGIILMLIPAVLFSYLLILMVIKEEKFLINKLGAQYKDYMNQVRWRLIPKIF